MSRSQHSPALERLIHLLIEGADDAVLDHILLDAVESLELAEGIAIWRMDQTGKLKTCLSCGLEAELPTREQLAAHLAGSARLGPRYHVGHASLGRGEESSDIVLVLSAETFAREVDAADILLELCARSARPADLDCEQPPPALPGIPANSFERELAHDLRNHLAGLRTVCDVLQVLEKELEEDERDHYGAVLQRECRRAGELLAGALESDLATTELEQAFEAELLLALRDVLTSEAAAYRLANAELVTRIQSDEASKSYRLGAFDFSRVVRNLLVNVREACTSPSGPATHVMLELQPDRSGRGGLILSVEDDGPGIAPEIRERLFEEGVSTKHTPNSGSGLAAVHALVENVGGEVRVQHLPVRGTRFQVWIPEYGAL